jgi:hypothetical protein
LSRTRREAAIWIYRCENCGHDLESSPADLLSNATHRSLPPQEGPICDHLTDCTPLTADEIDNLCERLNSAAWARLAPNAKSKSFPLHYRMELH